MALLSLTPPPPFLQTPGEPTITFDAWVRSFNTYLTALSDKELADKRKRALLVHCIGVEAQRIFFTLATGTTYDKACKALKSFFVPKVNVVSERNKFRLRRQNVGHPGDTNALCKEPQSVAGQHLENSPLSHPLFDPDLGPSNGSVPPGVLQHLAGLPAFAIRLLQLIQNAAACLVFNLPRHFHVTPL
ncbi:uncharacterized protein LOC133131697 isoform X2 [Conger conger]|uniref:uncharacterized protein LOC133131697 isoform X2 n=1 Tax=Conger conger TaxID=82655 RepID=UPI002A59EBF0|nr:uncharacterized protein LOC133131697 isoform X2 [Conger conger]